MGKNNVCFVYPFQQDTQQHLLINIFWRLIVVKIGFTQTLVVKIAVNVYYFVVVHRFSLVMGNSDTLYLCSLDTDSIFLFTLKAGVSVN